MPRRRDSAGAGPTYTDALLTDFYQLTMAAGYLESGRAEDPATFELFFRQNPFRGGYAIAAGLEPAVRALLGVRFTRADLDFLAAQRSATGAALFPERFLEYLERHRFRGTIRAIPEGTVVFPIEPLVQVSGGLLECQLAETLLLCHVNYQTLVATRAARLWEASNHGTVIEFGLRRAPGPDGGLGATRAASIGGAEATSNVLGSARFGVPARGTHAHSWVQAFDSELDAFRAYARLFPDDAVLLVDTYDVLGSGVPNAIRVGRELAAAGRRLAGIRLDSGDLAALSRRARAMLDEAGLDHVKIVASNDLDEYVIEDILAQGGRIDVWGVGTHLVAGGGERGAALGGVYKLVEHRGEPRIKLSGNPDKTTNPGAKRIVRFYDAGGTMEGDAVAPAGEEISSGPVEVVDPRDPARRTRLSGRGRRELLETIVSGGELVYDFPPVGTICARRRDDLARLDASHRRLRDAREYDVGLTASLWRVKERMLARDSG
jgi:nicotinate phosphoribosyltransferase